MPTIDFCKKIVCGEKLKWILRRTHYETCRSIGEKLKKLMRTRIELTN